jgi:hypothetical protein
MNIYEQIERTEKFFHLEMKKVSEDTSSCSTIPTHFVIRDGGIKNSRDALATLVALDWATPGTRNFHKIEHIREHIMKMCVNSNGEGGWKLVLDYLQNVKPFVIYESITFILKNMTLEDYHGNFKKMVRTQIRKIKVVKTYLSVFDDTSSYNKKMRKRGYDDKGSLKPLHQRGRVQPRPAKELITIIPVAPKRCQWYNEKDTRNWIIVDTIPGDLEEEGGQ